jgi:hypothetical protein
MFYEALALVQPPARGGAIPQWKPLAERIMGKHAELRPYLQYIDTPFAMERFLMDVAGVEDIELVYGIDGRALEGVKHLYFLLHPMNELPAPEGIANLPKHFISRAYALSLGVNGPDHFYTWPSLISQIEPDHIFLNDAEKQRDEQNTQLHVFSRLLTAYSHAIAHGGACSEDHMEACSEFRKILNELAPGNSETVSRALHITSEMPLDTDPIAFCETVREHGLHVARSVHVEGVPLEYARATV